MDMYLSRSMFVFVHFTMRNLQEVVMGLKEMEHPSSFMSSTQERIFVKFLFIFLVGI